jgi:hypothetical protein
VRTKANHSQAQTRGKPEPVRVNRGYKLREDLIDECKHLAITQKRNLYEIMEDAIEDYLARERVKKLGGRARLPNGSYVTDGD